MSKLVAAAMILLALPAWGAARFAVVAGNDVGATGRPQLWYAERDADRFSRALTELGDFPADHVAVLKGASATELRNALQAVEAKVAAARAAGERALFVIYFSGHGGAGDADGDGKVTLAEAFRYTAARTVAGTASTRAGPQHPTYEFKMSGRGDVVLADLRHAEATLRLPADKEASYVVRGPHEFLAEIPGSSTGTTLALPSAGHYTVERRNGFELATAAVNLDRGEVLSLPPLRPSAYEAARAKGGPSPWLLFLGGGVESNPLAGAMPMLRAGGKAELGSFSLRLRLDYARRDATDSTLRYSLTALDAGAALLSPFFAGPFLFEVGPELGGGFSYQQLQAGSTYSTPDLQAGLVAVTTFRAGPLRIGLDLTAGARTFRLDNSTSVKPAASAALMFFYGL